MKAVTLGIPNVLTSSTFSLFRFKPGYRNNSNQSSWYLIVNGNGANGVSGVQCYLLRGKSSKVVLGKELGEDHSHQNHGWCDNKPPAWSRWNGFLLVLIAVVFATFWFTRRWFCPGGTVVGLVAVFVLAPYACKGIRPITIFSERVQPCWHENVAPQSKLFVLCSGLGLLALL